MRDWVAFLLGVLLCFAAWTMGQMNDEIQECRAVLSEGGDRDGE